MPVDTICLCQQAFLVHHTKQTVHSEANGEDKVFSKDSDTARSADVFDKVAEIARASGKVPGDCVKCASDILTAFQQAGVAARKVELRSDYPYILHKSNLDEPITQNGRHFAIEVAGKIYDAFHPQGIARGEYIKQFEALDQLRLLEVE